MNSLVFLLVAFFSALCYAHPSRLSTNGNVASIPLSQLYKNGPYSLEAFQRSLTLARMGGGRASLHDYQDMYYYGPLSVGTPEQTITVNFDTGSADLWLPSNVICWKYSRYCQHHHVFYYSDSKTFRTNLGKFNIGYSNGSVSGIVSQDNFAVAKLPVKGQRFGEARYVDDITAQAEFDGVFGLAYPSLSFVKTTPPFVNMIKQKAVKNPVFAFNLNKNEPFPDASGRNITGILVLGGVDPAHYTGDITYTNVIEQKYWTIQLDRVSLDSKEITSSTKAIPDSGTSFLVGPNEIIDPINEAIGGKKDREVYIVDCSTIDTLPDVTFIVSGAPFVLKPEDYIIKVPSKAQKDDVDVCISGFVGDPEIQFTILGHVFMKKFYTVFDMGQNRVGFALAK